MARLYYLLSVSQHRLSTFANRETERELGLTAAQLAALLALDSSPNLHQSELAKALSCTKPAVTAMAERLLQAELIERHPCPDDGRAMRLSLSRKGKRTVTRGKALVAEMQAQLCEGFSDEEMNVVARFLNSTIERFQ